MEERRAQQAAAEPSSSSHESEVRLPIFHPSIVTACTADKLSARATSALQDKAEPAPQHDHDNAAHTNGHPDPPGSHAEEAPQPPINVHAMLQRAAETVEGEHAPSDGAASRPAEKGEEAAAKEEPAARGAEEPGQAARSAMPALPARPNSRSAMPSLPSRPARPAAPASSSSEGTTPCWVVMVSPVPSQAQWCYAHSMRRRQRTQRRPVAAGAPRTTQAGACCGVCGTAAGSAAAAAAAQRGRVVGVGPARERRGGAAPSAQRHYCLRPGRLSWHKWSRCQRQRTLDPGARACFSQWQPGQRPAPQW